MANKPKVRLAVIGVGNMGSFHVRELIYMPNANLAVVCDIARTRRSSRLRLSRGWGWRSGWIMGVVRCGGGEPGVFVPRKKRIGTNTAGVGAASNE